jgi:hypothetical protein
MRKEIWCKVLHNLQTRCELLSRNVALTNQLASNEIHDRRGSMMTYNPLELAQTTVLP